MAMKADSWHVNNTMLVQGTVNKNNFKMFYLLIFTDYTDHLNLNNMHGRYWWKTQIQAKNWNLFNTLLS